MDSLKFLGKPAPKEREHLQIRGYNFTRSEHLDGAIKEAAELLEKSILEKPIPEFKKWAKTNPTQFINFRNRPGQFVAFLLRKTIGEQT